MNQAKPHVIGESHPGFVEDIAKLRTALGMRDDATVADVLLQAIDTARVCERACEETRVFFGQARRAHAAVVEMHALLNHCAGMTGGREFALRSDSLRAEVSGCLARVAMPPAPTSALCVDLDSDDLEKIVDDCEGHPVVRHLPAAVAAFRASRGAT